MHPPPHTGPRTCPTFWTLLPWPGLSLSCVRWPWSGLWSWASETEGRQTVGAFTCAADSPGWPVSERVAPRQRLSPVCTARGQVGSEWCRTGKRAKGACALWYPCFVTFIPVSFPAALFPSWGSSGSDTWSPPVTLIKVAQWGQDSGVCSACGVLTLMSLLLSPCVPPGLLLAHAAPLSQQAQISTLQFLHRTSEFIINVFLCSEV